MILQLNIFFQNHLTSFSAFTIDGNKSAMIHFQDDVNDISVSVFYLRYFQFMQLIICTWK
jgi:hypothetical protein